jgi:Spy/CpxP family protein refolding chaperone
MKLRETYEGRVPVQAPPSQDSHSREELEAMVANPEYKTNPAYRAKVEKMFEQAFG